MLNYDTASMRCRVCHSSTNFHTTFLVDVNWTVTAIVELPTTTKVVDDLIYLTGLFLLTPLTTHLKLDWINFGTIKI